MKSPAPLLPFWNRAGEEEESCIFYARHEQRDISRKIVISPMVDRRALPVAEALGIEVYSYADAVEGL